MQNLNANPEKGYKREKTDSFLHLIPKEKILRTTASYISLMFAHMRNRWNRYTLSIWKHLWKRKNLRADFGQCYILEIQYSTVLHLGERGSTNPLCTKQWTLSKNWKTIFSICILSVPKTLNSLLQGYFPVTHLDTVAQQPETFYFESFSSCASLAHLTFPEIAFFFIEKMIYNSRLELAIFKKRSQTHLEVFKINLL